MPFAEIITVILVLFSPKYQIITDTFRIILLPTCSDPDYGCNHLGGGPGSPLKSVHFDTERAA